MKGKKGWINEMIIREATPLPERTDTVEDFCKKHGVPSSTYRYNAAKKENKKKIIEIWLNEAVNDGNEVLAKLGENAKAGKEKSIEMYLKFILKLKDELDITTDGNPININIAKDIADKYESSSNSKSSR